MSEDDIQLSGLLANPAIAALVDQDDWSALHEVRRSRADLARFIDTAAAVPGVSAKDIELLIERSQHSHMMGNKLAAAIRAALKEARQ